MANIEKTLRGQEILARAALARTNFQEFVRFVGNIDPPQHQELWLEAAQKIGDAPAGKKYIIIAPPGSGKTTLIGVLFISWMVGRYPERHTGLLSYSDAVGWDRSGAIKRIITESLPYQLVFPKIRPEKKKWGVAVWQVQRPDPTDPHPTLRAGGTMSAVVAYRLNGLLIDDAHDQKNSATGAFLDKVWKNYADAILTRMTSDSWQLVIGTRWSDKDFIGRLLLQKGWKKIHIPAINEKGESYWPEEYPISLLVERKNQHPAMFATQYQGDTTGGEAQMISKVPTYDDDPRYVREARKLLVGAGWDTALKDKQQNDFSVGYIGGMDRFGRIFVLERKKGRWLLPELMINVNDSSIDWHCAGIWVEDSAAGTPAVETLKQTNPHLPITTVSPTGGGKNPRANVIATFLQSGHLIFPKFAEWFPDAEYELTHFGYTGHDDDIDALFILVDNLTKMRHPDRYINRPEYRLEMR